MMGEREPSIGEDPSLTPMVEDVLSDLDWEGQQVNIASPWVTQVRERKRMLLQMRKSSLTNVTRGRAN